MIIIDFQIQMIFIKKHIKVFYFNKHLINSCNRLTKVYIK
jgi:hypothetical protein